MDSPPPPHWDGESKQGRGGRKRECCGGWETQSEGVVMVARDTETAWGRESRRESASVLVVHIYLLTAALQAWLWDIVSDSDRNIERGREKWEEKVAHGEDY